MRSILRLYLYCVSSVVLFAGTFIAIPRTYNFQQVTYAHEINIDDSSKNNAVDKNVYDLYQDMSMENSEILA